MINKRHNNSTTEFLQKLLFYIDSTLINAVSAEKEDKNKILVGGLLKLKDVIFSEIVTDSFAGKIKTAIETKKNQEQTKEQENLSQKDLSQEKK